MPSFTSFDGTEISYHDEGEGDVVLLLHGFASDAKGNWGGPGVIRALVVAGHRVVAPDARGHGASGKPHDSAAYADGAMVKDAKALLDHLGVEQVDLAGYSMGAMVSAYLATDEPRIRRLVLGGMGGALVKGRRPGATDAIADALEADDPKAVADPTARGFRAFADSTGADRLALAAVQRSSQFTVRPDLSRITAPTLVLVGVGDDLVGPPQPLADAILGATVQLVAGDHLTAVADPGFSQAIVDFFAAQAAPA